MQPCSVPYMCVTMWQTSATCVRPFATILCFVLCFSVLPASIILLHVRMRSRGRGLRFNPKCTVFRAVKMAALSGVQRILCPETQIRRACSRIRHLCFRGAYIPLRSLCLPALSLTRTPGGRHVEWAAAFFDPCFERLEKAVYFVGLVSQY